MWYVFFSANVKFSVYFQKRTHALNVNLFPNLGISYKEARVRGELVCAREVASGSSLLPFRRL